MAMTMKRLGPALGTTAHALRASLTSAELLDPLDKRPTRTAHQLGCAYYVERLKGDDMSRFPAWNRDALLLAAPALVPAHEDTLRSFTTRWAAADAMRSAAMEMRELAPELAPELETFAADATKDHIEGLTQGLERMAWSCAVLTPARLALASAMHKTQGDADLQDQMARLDGALQWLSSPVRNKCATPAPITAPDEVAIDRAVRTYADSVSIGITDAERQLLDSGYTFNHLRPRPEDKSFVTDMLGPISELIDPAAVGMHYIAGRQPLRASKRQGRHVIGTITTLNGGMQLAAAHHADITGNRITIQSDDAGFVLHDGKGEPIEQNGKPWTTAWLRDLVATSGSRQTKR